MQKRILSRLTRRPFDLLIVGNTHLSHYIAWDATIRGLKVALVATGDFGSGNDPVGTSLVRGGMRLLDSGFQEARQMVLERQALLRTAPHLTRPLPHLLVTENQNLRLSGLGLYTAVQLNQLLNAHHNFGLDPAHQLAHGRSLSRKKLIQHHQPLMFKRELGGGAIWEEAQILNPQRLQLAVLQSAVDGGAIAANYVRVEKLRTHRGRVVGVEAVDELTQAPLQIGAKVVIDATPGAIDRWREDERRPYSLPNIAIYLVTRQLVHDKAIQFQCGNVNSPCRTLTITPWHNSSIIGPFQSANILEWGTEALLDYVNTRLPQAELRLEDIYKVVHQILPADDEYPEETTLFPHTRLVDHAQQQGLFQLISARAASISHSRYVAEKAVDLAYCKLQRPSPTCRTRQTRISGGQITHWQTFTVAAMEKWPIEMPPYQIRRYLTHYGSQHRTLIPLMLESYGNEQPIWEDTDVTRAEVIFAVRKEMALTLADVVLRRTELGATKPPSIEALEAAADLMALELGWSTEERIQQIDNVLVSMNTLQY